MGKEASIGLVQAKRVHPQVTIAESHVRGSPPLGPWAYPQLVLFEPEEWKRLADRLALPERQQEVARLILSGYGDKQIASSLHMSLPTVRSHIGRLFQRLGARNRQEIILKIFFEFLVLTSDTAGPIAPAAPQEGN